MGPMLDYDMPLYRPPSEGGNLIIQATLGCSFNQCSFCSMYRDKRYVARPLAAVLAEIDAAARAWPDAHRVFLADGDALVLPTEHLLAICDHLARRFPDLQRVSAYATPIALLRKSPEELARLKAARLGLVYLGIESGDPEILRRVAKGATQKSMIRALSRAREAEIKVSATVVLGLGGAERWRRHIDGTVAVVNAAPPNFLSTLQLRLDPRQRAAFLARFDGAFTWMDDDGMLAELERLVAGLAPPRPVIFRSNHASNALPLKGTLPKDRDRLLAEIAASRRTGRLRPAFLRGF